MFPGHSQLCQHVYAGQAAFSESLMEDSDCSWAQIQSEKVSRSNPPEVFSLYSADSLSSKIGPDRRNHHFRPPPCLPLLCVGRNPGRKTLSPVVCAEDKWGFSYPLPPISFFVLVPNLFVSCCCCSENNPRHLFRWCGARLVRAAAACSPLHKFSMTSHF